MPQILVKLIGLCQSEDSSLEELAQLIETDAGMSAKVLSVANSAAYYRGGRKVNLLQALTVLGSDLVRTLVISESVFQTFNGFPHSAEADLRVFWKHSLTAAVNAKEIAKAMGYPNPEEAYLAGLLHDVGRLALMATAPNEYAELFPCADDDLLCRLEENAFGVTHADAGAWLAERWNMDSFVADSVLYHHESRTRLESTPALVRLVHLAQSLSLVEDDADIDEQTGALCAIGQEDLRRICLGTRNQVIQAADMLGIDLTGLDGSKLASSARRLAPPVARSVAQSQLSDGVRDMALLAEVGQVLGQQKTDEQVLNTLRHLVQINLQLDAPLYFMMRGNAKALVCVVPDDNLSRLADFAIQLPNGGAIAAAAKSGKAMFVTPEHPGLLLPEQQILRILQAQSLVCLPMSSAQRCWGVMVMGVASNLVPDLRQRARFIESLGSLAAKSLDAIARDQQQIDQSIDALKAAYLARSRRMVHEVNNPLGIIKNYLSVVDGKLQRQEPIGDELKVVREEIDRVGNIMSDFSGSTKQAGPAVADINQVVRDLVRLFTNSKFLPSTVRVVTELPEGKAEMTEAADLLKQVLINLMKNAIEAMPQGGQLRIENLGLSQQAGQTYWTLRITDTGPGLPADVMAKLFAPVRSAKPGANRGIGLSIVSGLVKRMNGRIACHNSAQGASFELQLPARAKNNATAALART